MAPCSTPAGLLGGLLRKGPTSRQDAFSLKRVNLSLCLGAAGSLGSCPSLGVGNVPGVTCFHISISAEKTETKDKGQAPSLNH